MKRNYLYLSWAGLFVLCAGLGFLPESRGVLKFFRVMMTLVFFIPPLLLLRLGKKQDLMLMRNLSAMSLALTVVLLIVNVLSIRGSEVLGLTLHYILTIISAPMICSQYWFLSLFLWAFLMIACISGLKKKEKH